jgi:CO/xanthine dehydrogenase Mo-binding subunit
MRNVRVPHPIGQNVPRAGGRDKVAGSAIFPADLAARAHFHAATVRASVACARLDGIDGSDALSVPGVERILTAADVGGSNRFGLIVPDQPVLVERDIVGASDVIALVIAKSPAAAREGARRVRLSLTERSGVFDAARALHPGTPAVHHDRSNLLTSQEIRRGNAARAIAKASVVIEGTYRTGHIDHAFLSPEAGLAYVDDKGRLTVEVASQWPEADLRQAAAALGEPIERLRMVQTAIGGAFGGREDVSLQILLLLAAREMQAPVHMSWDRAESVRGHGKRHPFLVRHTLASTRGGQLVAAKIDLLLDAGCYTSSSVQLLNNALAHVTGPYAIRHVEVSGRVVFTNNPFTCAMRGFGVNQVSFVMEQQMNKLAAALDIDPADLRERNLIRGAGHLGAGARVKSLGGLQETIRQAKARGDRRGLSRPVDGRVFGRGFATSIKNVGYGFGSDDKATAEVCLTRKGALVRIGAADVGQGIETVIVQVAAATLGLPFKCIVVEWQDSTVVPEAGSSSASRQTMAAGNAVLGACRKILRVVHARGGTSALPDEGVVRRYTWRFPKTKPLTRGPGLHLGSFGCGTCVADVSVDTVTGEVRVLRVVSVIDAGRVVNPRLALGQVEGGAVMGQGYALTEHCAVIDGVPLTKGFEESGVPTAVDAPPTIEGVILESNDRLGPFGARGIGEIVMIPVVPAITAAIHAACGVWIDTLPATPERVRAALAERSMPIQLVQGLQAPQR